MNFNGWPEPFTGDLPAGAYRMDESPWPTGRIPSGVTIRGAGDDLTTITHDRLIVLEPGAHDVTIEGVRISYENGG